MFSLDHLSGYSKLQHIIIEQLSRGMQVTRSVKTKYILNSKRIKIASDQLELGILTINEFLVKCSYTVDGYILREGNWNRNVNGRLLTFTNILKETVCIFCILINSNSTKPSVSLDHYWVLSTVVLNRQLCKHFDFLICKRLT